MKAKIIASGSKGNCTFLLCDHKNFIIDIGISYLSLQKSLERNSLSLEDFEGVLITHSHSDHIKGLTSIINYTNLKILIPTPMYQELKERIPIERCLFIEDNNDFDEVNIELIHTSHDTECSVGYIVSHKNKKLVYVTDTGYINRKYLSKMMNSDIYIIESNHDEEMLMDGPYPYFIKQRVVGDSGHLSNKVTSKYLKKLVSDNTKYIVLAHISEKNNTEELAYRETVDRLGDTQIEIIIAKQDEESMLLEV